MDTLDTNIALIDNWSPELAGRVLEHSSQNSSLSALEQKFIVENPEKWLESLNEGIIALLQLIDLLVSL